MKKTVKVAYYRQGLEIIPFSRKYQHEFQATKPSQTLVRMNGDIKEFIEYDLISANEKETVWEEFNRGKVEKKFPDLRNESKGRVDKTVDPFDYEPFIKNLFEYYKDYSNVKLAEMIGISPSYITHFKNNLKGLSQKKRRNFYNKVIKNNLVNDDRGIWID